MGSGRGIRRIFFIPLAVLVAIIFILLLVPGAWAQGSEGLKVRVGIYDNPPKVTFDESTGEAGGFIPEILQTIAAKEGWQIEYVFGDWTTCLNRLAAGEIDVMVDVAYSEERAALYDFNSETVFNNWGVIYRAPDVSVENISDLEGKTVGVMKGSIHTEGPNGIRALVASFDVNCTFLESDSYEGIFRLIDSGSADAGVVNRLFGETSEGQFKVRRTGIYFDPSEIRYAFPKNAGLNPVLIGGIDSSLKLMKADKSSEYYSILDTYFGKASRVLVIPDWVLWAVLGFVAAILFLFGVSVLFKWQVNRKTRELKSALEKSEELEEIVNKSPAVVFLWRNEEDWPIDVVSDNVALFGYAPEEFTSGALKYAGILYPDDLERVAAEVKRHTSEATDEYSQTYRIKTRSGEVRWVEDHTSIRRDQDGNATHYQGIVTDITERKRAEDRIRESAQQLRDFLTVAAHELRHPITIMTGYSDLLLDRLAPFSDENSQAICHAVKASGERLNRTLTDLLDVSKIEQDTFAARLEEVNPVILVRNAIQEIRDAGCVNPIGLTLTDGVDESGRIAADSEMLRRLVVLLLDNAAKFSAADSPIDVEVASRDGEVEIAVGDRGVGISDEYADKVFDRFFQVEAVDHHSIPGMGMGLYIALEIVRAHRGKIWCESREGGGTIFRFTLPR